MSNDITLSPPPILGGTLLTWNATNQTLGYIGGNRWAYAFGNTNPLYTIFGIIEIDDFETATPSVTYLTHRAVIGSENIVRIIGLTDSRFVAVTTNRHSFVFEYEAGVLNLKATSTLTVGDTFVAIPVSDTKYILSSGTGGGTNTSLQTRIYEYNPIAGTISAVAITTTNSTHSSTVTTRRVAYSLYPGGVLINSLLGNTTYAMHQIDFSTATSILFRNSSPIIANAAPLAFNNNTIAILANNDTWHYTNGGLNGTFTFASSPVVGKTISAPEFSSYLGNDYFLIGNTSASQCRIIKWDSINNLMAGTFATLPGAGITLSTNPGTTMLNADGMNLTRYGSTDIFYTLGFNNTNKEWSIRKFKP
jgi:hypothetical protein